jgi:hypothetical protein
MKKRMTLLVPMFVILCMLCIVPLVLRKAQKLPNWRPSASQYWRQHYRSDRCGAAPCQPLGKLGEWLSWILGMVIWADRCVQS